MNKSKMILDKYSIGVGDRFAHQAAAQLQACILAGAAGIDLIPVWNKSNREHLIIGTDPAQTRVAADAAVKSLGWKHPYFCDADHIQFDTVDRFLAPCDFFTIDVADFIGQPAEESASVAFLERHQDLIGPITLPGSTDALEITSKLLRGVADKFLSAVQHAGLVYRKIESARGVGNFVAEISMDETDSAQSPLELLVILAAIADEGIPIQTIAPKFSGRFNKGVDYVGDVEQFSREFELDLAAIAYAVDRFHLPSNLKLSVHSGSDKFSIYPAIHAGMKKFNAGVHLKTAGTTWLEEVIGLAEADGDALALAKEIYAEAFAHREELCAPYATVINIDRDELPRPEDVAGWNSRQFTSALRHDQACATYNSSLRQLVHVGFKVAARMGPRYVALLEKSEVVIANNVTSNLYQRHIVPVFFGGQHP